MNLLLVGRSAAMTQLSELLRGLEGHQVHHCRTASAALRLLQKGPFTPDLLIRDAENSRRMQELLSGGPYLTPEAKPPTELDFTANAELNASVPRVLSAVETGRWGRRILSSRVFPPGLEAGEAAPDLDQIIFEYRAPCRKTGT